MEVEEDSRDEGDGGAVKGKDEGGAKGKPGLEGRSVGWINSGVVEGAEAEVDAGVERISEPEPASEVHTKCESGAGGGGKAAGEAGVGSAGVEDKDAGRGLAEGEDVPGERSSNLKVPSGRRVPNQTAQFR